MAHSLSEQCTPLKREYDACFNAWFEGYLEPAVSTSARPEERQKFAQEKAAEYERNCGKLWVQYRECVQKAVKDRGLESLLEQARTENPLKDAPPAPPAESS
ncbi:mitochondrial distribution/morphology family 35/apoptosis [Rhodofomes roseus]|uniref:Mitochondrial distribution/morphology family 35/apoptosis n=1 Tax=Rhodofomes roseus TaxID=34475 RepID=A0A4Y9YL18_9APHY|nr:mitochondrial distribution/morphology family 35/apoptosis [Rhodofomes roseus]KAH9830127.1 mitochondrial distribution/morphology family 35/apoptosis [Rhodofomes roseus]TFY62488.1 hypothetical protein EVJ58_g3835 [Rhodofomes roseus]